MDPAFLTQLVLGGSCSSPLMEIPMHGRSTWLTQGAETEPRLNDDDDNNSSLCRIIYRQQLKGGV